MSCRQIILQATTTARRAQHKSFLERIPILEQLTEYEILTIADALVEDSYQDGDVICTQGEVGDAFYIIKKVPHSPCRGFPGHHWVTLGLRFVGACLLQSLHRLCGAPNSISRYNIRNKQVATATIVSVIYMG